MYTLASPNQKPLSKSPFSCSIYVSPYCHTLLEKQTMTCLSSSNSNLIFIPHPTAQTRFFGFGLRLGGAPCPAVLSSYGACDTMVLECPYCGYSKTETYLIICTTFLILRTRFGRGVHTGSTMASSTIVDGIYSKSITTGGAIFGTLFFRVASLETYFGHLGYVHLPPEELLLGRKRARIRAP
jgi:hypothetical protein